MFTLLILVITYIIVSWFAWIAHWALHQKWSGRFYKSHLVHHSLYTTEDFMSSEYRSAGGDDTAFIFAALSIPIIVLPIILFLIGWFSLPLMIGILFEMGILGFLNNYIHETLHIKNHFLQSFPIGRFWRKLHFIHHRSPEKNIGIFTFWTDKIMGTYDGK